MLEVHILAINLMSNFRYHHVQTICFLPPLFGSVYYIHNHSNVSLETLRTMFSGYPIVCTTPTMTEVCIECNKKDELRDFRDVVFDIFRMLLESGDERNNDKVFICITTLSIIADILLKQREDCILTRSKVKQINNFKEEIITSLKPRILNEAYLNHTFVYYFNEVRNKIVNL